MRISRNIYYVLLIFVVVQACKNPPDMYFENVDPQDSGVDFNNVISENDSFNILKFLYIYNGAGVAVGDLNNDGYTDIFFSGNMVSNRLFLNKGSFTFEDVTTIAGLRDDHWCTGATMVDINSDGWMDIYVSVISPDAQASSPNLLFINEGIDPQGIPHFREAASAYGIDDPGYSTHAAFFDYDRDGDLDLYVLTNGLDDVVRTVPRLSGPLTDGSYSSTDRLYRNNANGTFTNVSNEAGITTEGWGLGVAIQDINRDGWPDIYVANDFLTNDLMYINNQDGTFTDSIGHYLKHQSHNGMGTDIADINNDGLSDIIVLDMMPEDNLRQKTMFGTPNNDKFQAKISLGYHHQYVRNTLQLNNGNGTFSEIGQLAGIYQTDWSWAPLMIDFNNDGLRDILITNGYHRDITDLDYINYSNQASMFGTEEIKNTKLYEAVQELQGVKKHNYIYQNAGGLRFQDRTKDWGLTDISYTNGAAFADFDNDGDLDLIMNNINDPAFLYKNQLISREKNNDKSHFLRIRLEDNDQYSNGLGAKVTIRYTNALGEKIEQYHDHSIYRGYKSTVESIIHFGLGDAEVVDTVEIIWPDGKQQQLTDISANQVLEVAYDNAVKLEKNDRHLSYTPIFTPVSMRDVSINYVHSEEPYDDFKYIRLLVRKYSEEGPHIATGDIDQNGREDIVIGGGNGYPGKYYLQTHEGEFKPGVLDTFHRNHDDMGVVLFDVDNDQDLDLYVVSGGNEVRSYSEYYQDRLYVNTGEGNWKFRPEAIPEIRHSGSCAIASDYDKDGDQDLFIGGRLDVENYPYPGTSYLLENQSGTFSDVTEKVAEGLQSIGMVTDAVWSDFDRDGWQDLIIVGEWMPLTIFHNQEGTLINVTTQLGLNAYTGWWNTIAQADIDADGDIDYLAGNLGFNSRFKASEEEPVCMFAKDYDQDGTIDPVLCYFIQGENYPLHSLSQMTSQMAAFKKRFIYFSDYGKVTYQRAFTENERKNAYVLKSQYFASSYIENLGDGTFKVHELPLEVQFAPIQGILVNDYTQDGHLDVLVTGNSYSSDSHIGRYDASLGYLLEGNGKGQFRVMKPNESGFLAWRDNRDLAEVAVDSLSSLIISVANQDSVKLHLVRYGEYQ